MSQLEAAIKDLEMIGDCRTCGNKDPFCEDNPDSCIGYKWRGAKDANKPLTVEELRKMNHEPVWLKMNGRNGEWALIRYSSQSSLHVEDRLGCHGIPLENYGEHWFAYLSKPEEETK